MSDKWVFTWMIVAVVLLLAVIFGARHLRVSSLESSAEEDLGQILDKVPEWQRRLRNFSRHYDADLIKVAISDFQAKHDGRLPELEEVTQIDEREDFPVWHYADLWQISDSRLSHYDQQELATPSFGSPASDKSFYGAPTFSALASFPDEENIHIWLGYTCAGGEHDGYDYADIVEKSVPSDFAIVYSIEDPEHSTESDESTEVRQRLSVEFVRCLGGEQ